MVTRKARWAAPPQPAPGDAPLINQDTPVEVVRQIFGRNLWTQLSLKGWNQSELARRANISRDSVSTYVRALALPDPANLQKIAQALGVEPSVLNPGVDQAGVESAVASVEFKESVGRPGFAWLRVNREVPFSVAVKILALLEGGA